MIELWDPRVADNPLAFVLFCFPWGKPGTPLERFQGPRSWQREELSAIAEHIKGNKERMAQGLRPKMYNSATSSGRGSGKSALTSWLIHWMLTTRIGSTVIVTANTEPQLKSRTWAELGKWHTLAINAHWFDRQALSLKPAMWYAHSIKNSLKIDDTYYYAAAQLWSEENPDAFAGVHNPNGVLLIMDEASGISEPIWTVSEGFFTEPELHRYWFAFSNPRKNTGAFYDCFHKHRDYWKTRNLDSRTVEGTDTDYLNRIIEKYGIDSDPARIEVLGQFPRTGDSQFISRDIIENAATRELPDPDPHAPLIMGVDPARFGSDSTVICFRQGRDARSIPAIKMKGADNMQVASTCAHWISKLNPDAVFIDAGNGTGIIDRLREMNFKVNEVWFGSKSQDQEWANKRTEIWARLRDWLGGGCIPNESELKEDLAGPEYRFMGAGDKIILESKEEMKKRGLHSPDWGDALSCTFSEKVARRDLRVARNRALFQKETKVARDVDYSLFNQ